MKKVNFDVELKNVEGEVLGKLSETMAMIFQQSTEGNAVKLNGWAVKLYTDGFIEIDDADIQTLIDFTTNEKRLYNVTKAAALEILQKAKTEV